MDNYEIIDEDKTNPAVYELNGGTLYHVAVSDTSREHKYLKNNVVYSIGTTIRGICYAAIIDDRLIMIEKATKDKVEILTLFDTERLTFVEGTNEDRLAYRTNIEELYNRHEKIIDEVPKKI